jgi:hypothetical protein
MYSCTQFAEANSLHGEAEFCSLQSTVYIRENMRHFKSSTMTPTLRESHHIEENDVCKNGISSNNR